MVPISLLGSVVENYFWTGTCRAQIYTARARAQDLLNFAPQDAAYEKGAIRLGGRRENRQKIRRATPRVHCATQLIPKLRGVPFS
jgi:hypothetical protein